MKQLSLFPEADTVISSPAIATECYRLETKFAPIMREELRLGSLVAYGGNKTIPLLRLYRYKEAFSFGFVKEFITRFQLTEKDYLFDSFSGMGTTLFTSIQQNISSIAIDRLPIGTFVTNTLPLFLLLETQILRSTFALLKTKVVKMEPAEIALDVSIMKVAFSEETLLKLRLWKSAIDTLSYPLQDIFSLLFLAILEPCSYTTKDGQFLRLNRDKNTIDPELMMENKVYEAENDLLSLRSLWGKRVKIPKYNIQLGDARDLTNIYFDKPPTALITSPPYANRYDYTRTYSLELCFNFVKNFEELKTLRFGILRSHIESKIYATDQPPHPVVTEIVEILQKKSLNNPRIPDMLIAYFVDMRQVISEWARVLAPKAKIAMVVDNVRFEGEMVPVDLILSEMAEEFGFKIEEIIIARYKGNSSQQMGKYGRVPVRESIVIWTKENDKSRISKTRII